MPVLVKFIEYLNERSDTMPGNCLAGPSDQIESEAGNRYEMLTGAIIWAWLAQIQALT